ncbi:hypothetical protein CHH91_10890 [Virgibacillus sp. 7505]|uniref:hypothetical protein n=1 Tax=Virgibacillus sp. 7505 TaxID=2022548 RepID=UPI000BA7B998|nr:hypothetical protein [Virgibacillus sp. 7505]PAE16131.1 hypothetical protein CHH91_10890 [Virgibacillus sp. 7505]
MSNEKNSVSPSEMDPSDLPDVPAFQDEFTRDFLQSTEQTKKGYYPLLSGSNSFTMDFPKDMVISKESYNIQSSDKGETIVISYPSHQGKAFIIQSLSYSHSQLSAEDSKEQMVNSAGRELNFQAIESSNEKQHIEIAEYEDDSLSIIEALIWNDNNEAIQTHTTITCKEETNKEECTKSKEIQKEKALDMLKSIQLIGDESE